MRKITLDEFNDRGNEIGVLIKDMKELEIFRKFINLPNWSSNTQATALPIIVDAGGGDYQYISLYYDSISKSRHVLEEYMESTLIVSPCHLEMPIEYYNGKIACIATQKEAWFTKGKIYEVTDGTFKDNQGDWIHKNYDMKKIEKFEDCNRFARDFGVKFIKIVED